MGQTGDADSIRIKKSIYQETGFICPLYPSKELKYIKKVIAMVVSKNRAGNIAKLPS